MDFFVNFIIPRHSSLVNGLLFSISVISFNFLILDIPFRDLWLQIFICCCFLTRGLGLRNRRNSAEFSIEFQKLGNIFRKSWFVDWVGIPVFQMSYDIVTPCEFLVGFWETETHTRTRGGCHMSTFGSGHDNFISIKAVDFLNLLTIFLWA